MHIMNTLKKIGGLFITFLILVIFLGAEQVVRAANPPAVQEYYVPISEADLLDSMQSLFPSSATCLINAPEVIDPAITVVSIAATADDTFIYYDHWEDGFEADLANPTQPTTLVWGDGILTNGSVPGQLLDVISAGTTINLQQEIISTLPDVIDFDGRDRLGASRAIAVSRAGWSKGPGTSFAGATELLNVGNWGEVYEIPVGPSSDTEQTFEHVSLHIMAAEDNTAIALDRDGDGVVDFTTMLNQGESHHENGGVGAGSTLKASEPIQVQMVTGDICTAYESRWYTLLPVAQLGNSYYSPVSTDASSATSIFVYNPNATPIVINWDVLINDVVVSQPAIVLNSSKSRRVEIPDESAAHFYTSGADFYALAAVDTTAVYDWGYSLWPEHALSQKAVVAWGPGVSPNVVSSENGNPVWATVIMPDPAVAPVKLCVDYEGDGSVDTFYMMGYLKRQPIFDPYDNDQSGMLVFVCDASGAKVSAAWGPQPLVASPGLPGIDVGTAALPLPMVESGATADLLVDADADGAVSAGDTLKYRIVTRNSGSIGLQNVTLMGDVPAATSYVPGSTTTYRGTQLEQVPDSGSTLFPFDEASVSWGNLPVNGFLEIAFEVTVDTEIPAATQQITAQFMLKTGSEQSPLEVETPLNFEPSVMLQKTVYTGHDSGSSCPGGETVSVIGEEAVTYCFTITNTGDTHLVGLNLDDTILGVNLSHMTLLSGDATVPLAPTASLIYFYETTADRNLVNTATIDMIPADETGAVRGQLAAVTAADTASVLFQNAPTFTATPTSSPTMTPGPTTTGTTTVTPSPTATATATATASPSSTATPSPTTTATATATASPSPSPTATGTATETPSPTATATATATASPSPSPSATITATTTVTPSPTATSTVTPTVTATLTPTVPITPTVPSQLGDIIWLDVDLDGVQNDAGDSLGGITVNLYDDAEQLVDTTVSDASGHYQFDVASLPVSSSYLLKLDNPADYHSDGPLGDLFLTTADADADDIDSDATYDSAGYPTMVVTALDTTYDIGFVPGSCMTDVTGQINPDDPTLATATNHNGEIPYLVGLAIYQKVDEVIDHQILYDFHTATVLPNQSVDLAVEMPDTAVQVDLFCGPVLYSLADQRYEDRLIEARHVAGTLANDGVCPADYVIHGVYQDQVLSENVIIELQTDRAINNWLFFELTGPDLLSEQWRETTPPYYFMGDRIIDGKVVPNGWDTTSYPDGAYTISAVPNDADCKPAVVEFTVQNTVMAGGVRGKVMLNGIPRGQANIVMEAAGGQTEEFPAWNANKTYLTEETPATFETQTDANGDYQFDDIPFGLYKISLGDETDQETDQYVHLQANAAGYMEVSFIEETEVPTAISVRQAAAQPLVAEVWTIIATFMLLVVTVLYVDHYFALRRKS